MNNREVLQDIYSGIDEISVPDKNIETPEVDIDALINEAKNEVKGITIEKDKNNEKKKVAVFLRALADLLEN